MNNEIEIKIKQDYKSITVIMVVSFLVGLYSFACMVYYRDESKVYSILNGVIFIIMVALFFLSLFLSEKPTVVRSDGINLYWKFLYRQHEISLNDITGIACEPYSVFNRYGTYQRIRLTLYVNKEGDSDKIVFNDQVDAGDLIEEKLKKKSADIPIMKLYAYLIEHSGNK